MATNYQHIYRSAFLCVSILYACASMAQSEQSQQAIQQQIIQMAHPHPAAKEVQRYEVDAKRMGVGENSEDALPRSREFKRIDSSYYVGWMFEGTYKYNHAADYLGFKNASVPLAHALDQLERDYKKMLSTRTDNLIVFIPAYKFQTDYSLIAYYLVNCYSNMDEPEKVYALLRRTLKWNMQRDYVLDVYNWLAWTVHRNRFYTSAKYSFLKNSIDANEKLANSYLDTQLTRIKKNYGLNSKIFRPGYEATDKMAVYHYKNILYSYAFNIDSADYYFGLMREGPVFPHNNYATFRTICGDFRTAESEYKLAMDQDNGDKRLKEWAYYRSILDIYKGMPKAGGQLCRDMIKANGTTPGFGWYNIALARCTQYDGNRSEAERYINKAAEFKELHIGTTLGQSHYDFSVQLLKLINKMHAQEAERFEHANWWYNPQVLAKMAQLTADKYLQQFLIINQFAQNPERDRVIYKLFSTESTVTWDEVYYLISDFSTQYFLDRFNKEIQTDRRKNITRYFKYFVAQLEIKQGDYTKARAMLDDILKNQDIDAEYEALFLARVFQAEAVCAQKREDKNAYNEWMYKAYVMYPQLIPYTGLKMNMILHIAGDVDEKAAQQLKACNINWVTDTDIPAPEAFVTFSNKGGKKSVQFYVRDRSGKVIVEQQGWSYTEADVNAGITVAYRLFNIGGKISDKESKAAY